MRLSNPGTGQGGDPLMTEARWLSSHLDVLGTCLKSLQDVCFMDDGCLANQLFIYIVIISAFALLSNAEVITLY